GVPRVPARKDGVIQDLVGGSRQSAGRFPCVSLRGGSAGVRWDRGGTGSPNESRACPRRRDLPRRDLGVGPTSPPPRAAGLTPPCVGGWQCPPRRPGASLR